MSNSNKILSRQQSNNTVQPLVFGQGTAKSTGLNFNISNNGGAQFIASKNNMPKFLISANTAVENGRIDQAAELLSDQAVETVNEIFARDNSRLDILFVLAELFNKTGQLLKAEHWYKKILEQDKNAYICYQLARICKQTDRIFEMIEYTKKAIEAEPENTEFISNLGLALMAAGEINQGSKVLRKVIEINPSNTKSHSDWLRTLHYLPGITNQQIFDEHKQWAQIHMPIGRAKTDHDNNRDPDRRLRVGYISPDFREHSVAYFFEPLLNGHDRDKVELYGYANVKSPDEFTLRLQNKFDHYRDIAATEAKQIAELIERDKIDILVDLAGHTTNNSLAVLAYKPAPVQVTYLGYPDTTGMEQVDYRFTDDLADLPQAKKFYTEELIKLPQGFLCYLPSQDAPPVGPLPALKKGYVTFGSFNNNCKINPYILGLWTQILKANKNSRMLLKFKYGNDNGIRDYYLRQFEQLGISPDRVEVFGWKSKAEHFDLYNHIDIALDTYPYNGTTTTCEALWMGVPVVSLIGEHHVSRVGLSILNRIGMEFFAASNPEQYVSKAISIALKPDALAKIRAQIRLRMIAGDFCNSETFVKTIEQKYRMIWQKFCKK